MAQASGSADFWLSDERQADLSRRLWRAVAISLVLHVGVLAAVAWIRLPKHAERPLASIEISLATMPAPPVKATEPLKAAEPPKSQPKAVETPAPVPPPKMAPAPVKAPSNDVMGDVMKGIALPPNAPKFGDFSPTEKPKKAQIKLPDVPVATETKEPIKKPEAKPQPSLTEDLSKELDEEFKKINKVELPKAALADTLPKPMPQQIEAKAPSIKAVDSTLKVPGMAPGSNAYLGLVRKKISEKWNAPPVDAAGHGYVVIVQFRLHRNGSVTGVVIEQSSGNEYYDLSGKRAVLSATLPMFPPEVTEPYFDAHFTFTVGESQG